MTLERRTCKCSPWFCCLTDLNDTILRSMLILLWSSCSVPVKYLEGTRDDLPKGSSVSQNGIENRSVLPPHPTIIFINPKSGGQMGNSLLKRFGEVVGVVQVSAPGRCPWKMLSLTATCGCIQTETRHLPSHLGTM